MLCHGSANTHAGRCGFAVFLSLALEVGLNISISHLGIEARRQRVRVGVGVESEGKGAGMGLRSRMGPCHQKGMSGEDSGAEKLSWQMGYAAGWDKPMVCCCRTGNGT